jgi:alpha-N-acetylglucosaminidase
MRSTFALQLLLCACCGGSLASAAPKYSAADGFASTGGESPQAAAEALVARVLGGAADPALFSVTLTAPTAGAAAVEDRWSLATHVDSSGVVRVSLSAMDGVGVASALQHYLKAYCHRATSWSGDNMAALPSPLPAVPAGGVSRARTSGKWSYYQNVCTVSYSMAWWRWERWEKELDWMALRGVNLPLAFTGQEAVAQTVFRGLGVADADMGGFFSGPAFLAWYRMGNVRGVGLPVGAVLPQAWIDAQWALQLRIVGRAKALGMTPVLPGFAGFVPAALAAAQKAALPAGAVAPSASWDDAFNDTFCCNRRVNVSTATDFYVHLGSAFISAQRKALGPLAEGLHMYNVDQYNEMAPPFAPEDLAGLAGAATAQLASLRAADPAATWLMQGWLFLNSDVDFWGPAQIEAYLGAVDDEAMIILGLASDLKPLWQHTNSYYGKPFIWCMLHNFGGNVGLGGRAEEVLAEPLKALANASSSMVGIGITMEG